MDWKMTLLNERTKGREEGREEGILLEQIRTVERKLEKGLDLSEIAESMEMNEEEIRPVWEAVKASPPAAVWSRYYGCFFRKLNSRISDLCRI